MKRKILFIASYPTSLIRFRLHLMRTLLEKNNTIIACAPYDKNVVDILNKYGIYFIPIKLQRTGINPIFDLVFIYKLYQIIKRERPDIIFNYTIKPVVYGSLVGKLCGVSQIYSMITGLGYVFSETTLKGQIIGLIAKIFYKSTLQFNKKVFFQNSDNMQIFVNKQMVKSQNAILINGSGVDTLAYLPAVYSQKITFLMIARLIIDKGVREYFEAAKLVKCMHPDVEFLLVGWLDQHPNSISKKEFQSYIDSNIITYMGKLADVRPAIEMSSVYVLPSYSEGTPRTVLEAMAMARPIITTDVPGCRQTVVDGINGFLVPAKNVDRLVVAMCRFISNPSLIEKMGGISREIAVQKYDVNKVNANIIENMNC